MSLKIGILSTRGIPNRYGGFEQLAEYLSEGLAKKGHEVIVYNSHTHSYKEKKWRNVSLVHCYDPENKIGTSGQFIYDFNCVMDARKRKLDVWLILGYTSISIWKNFFSPKSTIIFNMDGFEWKRDKYSPATKKFLLQAEKLAVRSGDYFIADSTVVQTYLQKKYELKSEHIAYGAEIRNDEDEDLLQAYNISKKNYYLMVARIEPENNIEMILEGFSLSNTDKKMVVIGNASNKFGRYLTHKFRNDKRIQFSGTMYDKQIKHSLCHFSKLYFHGHSTGGTNPSLLEAMSGKALIVAHKNDFNRDVLRENAFYFSTANDVKNIIEKNNLGTKEIAMPENNLQKIKEHYSWGKIIDHYEKFIVACYNRKNN